MFHFYEAMPNKGFIITFVVWWYYYNVYAQYAATFFLALTRFTAVLFPTRHKRVSLLALFMLSSGYYFLVGGAHHVGASFISAFWEDTVRFVQSASQKSS